jgi:hypothetical protein
LSAITIGKPEWSTEGKVVEAVTTGLNLFKFNLNKYLTLTSNLMLNYIFSSEPAAVVTVQIKQTVIDSAIVTWTKVTVGKVDSYEIQISPTNNKETVDPSSVAHSSEPKATLRNQVPGTLYTLKMFSKLGSVFSSGKKQTYTSRKLVYLNIYPNLHSIFGQNRTPSNGGLYTSS